MLTVEILKQNTKLSGLSDEQLNAIATMSQNDENTVIGARIGELHGQYDTDVLGISGVTKKSGEKSYDYVKRVLGDYKTKLEASKNLQSQLDAANAQIEELKSKGPDETIKQELKDAKTRAEQLKNSLQAKETEFATAKANLEKQVMTVMAVSVWPSAVLTVTWSTTQRMDSHLIPFRSWLWKRLLRTQLALLLTMAAAAQVQLLPLTRICLST